MTGRMQVFRAEVLQAADLTPSLRRIVLGGPGLAGFESSGVGDEYLRVIVPAPGTTEPSLPTVVDGELDWATADLDLLRTYTVRDWRPDSGQLTIDFVVHDGGVAAAWARAAAPGDLVGVNTPTPMYDPPAGLEWQVLVTDCAGLPAACRLLETTQAVRTRLVLEVPSPEHRLPLPDHPQAEVTWVYGGNGHGPSRLSELVRSLPRPDPSTGGVGYVWVAGETRELRAVRRHLRHELRLPAASYKVVGYWTQRAEAWRAEYAALDPAVRASLESLWTSGRDEGEIEDEYDDRLERLGL